MVGPGTVRLRHFCPSAYYVFLANFPRRIGTFGWVSDFFCPIESDTFYKALTLYWL